MRSVLGAIAVLFVAVAGAAAEPKPAAVYGALPMVDDAAISPDGTKLALAGTVNGAPAVRVLSFDGRAVSSLFAVGVPDDSKLRGVGFADDKMATVTLSRTFSANQTTAAGWRRVGPANRFEYFRTGTLDLEERKFKYMMLGNDSAWAFSSLANLIAPIDGDPGYGRMIAPSSPGEGASLTVRRVNLKTGGDRFLEAFSDRTWSILLDEKGQALVRSESKERSNEWRILSRNGDSWRQIDEGVSETGSPPSLSGLLADGRMATFKDVESDETRALYAYDLSSGALSKVHDSGAFDTDRALHDPWTRRVVGAGWTEDLFPRQRYFDPELEAVRAEIEAAAGQLFTQVITWSKDRTRFIVYGESGPGAYYLYDRPTKKFFALGESYPAIAPTDMATTVSVKVKARDGVRIPAFVTHLPDRQLKGLPAVVLVHGGPHGARDDAMFDYWAQFIASRGYAVVQVNYRGSGGYGKAWQRSGYGQWGRLMQTDVEDVVRGLAGAGLIDLNRMCIVGASYGGFAALAGVTQTPDLYKCGVSVGGVADLRAMLKFQIKQHGADSAPADYWQRAIGDAKEDRASIIAVSPAANVEAIKAPVLLMHSPDDSVVPIEQSKNMEARMREAGKSVKLVQLKGDDHWLSRADTRTQMLEETEAFLREHLGTP